jgi:hypothetical protein
LPSTKAEPVEIVPTEKRGHGRQRAHYRSIPEKGTPAAARNSEKHGKARSLTVGGTQSPLSINNRGERECTGDAKHSLSWQRIVRSYCDALT